MKFRKIKAIIEMFLIITSIFVIYSVNVKADAIPPVTPTGICYQRSTYTCSYNVAPTSCNPPNKYFAGKQFGDQIDECELGCCILGSQYNLYTKEKCQKLHENINVDWETNWNGIKTAEECKAAASTLEGCCAKGDSCFASKQKDCNNEFSGKKCFNVIQCLNCKESDKSEAYCSDEDITKLVKKNSCGDITETVTCGVGEECREKEDGKAKCVNTNCKTSDAHDYTSVKNELVIKNGWSWCSYNGITGPGTDLPGSQHYIERCTDGKIDVETLDEPLLGYRNTICTETVVRGEGGKISKISAYPVDNNWKACISCDEAGTNEEKLQCCTDSVNTGMCLWAGDSPTCKPVDPNDKTINCNPAYDKYFSTEDKGVINRDDFKEACENIEGCSYKDKIISGKCIPIVPPGFKLITKKEDPAYLAVKSIGSYFTFDLSTPNADDLCKKADVSVQTKWEKDNVKKNWACKENCLVYSASEFLMPMESLCRSYGDCGASINFNDVYTDKGLKRNCGNTHGSKYDDGQGNSKECQKRLLQSVFNELYLSKDNNYSPPYKDKRDFSKNPFSTSLSEEEFNKKMSTNNYISDYLDVKSKDFFDRWMVASDPSRFYNVVNKNLKILPNNKYSELVINFRRDLGQGTYTEKAFKDFLGAATNTIVLAGGAVAAAALAYAVYIAIAVPIPYGVIIAVVVVIVSLIYNAVETALTTQEVYTISVQCKPWETPANGDCERCNKKMVDGGLLPNENSNVAGGYECQEYMCQTLGRDCTFKEAKEVADGYNKCFKDLTLVDRTAIPQIEFVPSSPTYDYTAPINVLVKTTYNGQPVLSRCNYNTKINVDYDNMDNENGGSLEPDKWASEHTINRDVLKVSPVEGDNNYYIRCELLNGNKNIVDSRISIKINKQEDATAPLIDKESYMINGLVYTTNPFYVKADTKHINVSFKVIEDLKTDEKVYCNWTNTPVDYDLRDLVKRITKDNVNTEDDTYTSDAIPCSKDGESSVQVNCDSKLNSITNLSIPVEQDEIAYYFRCIDGQGYGAAVASPQDGLIIRKTSALSASVTRVYGANEYTIVNGEIAETLYDTKINFVVESSAGLDGKSKCFYNKKGVYTLMHNEIKSEHTLEVQVADLPDSNNKKVIDVKCVDGIGNEVLATPIKFRSDSDIIAPVLISMNKDNINNKLKIFLSDKNPIMCTYKNQYYDNTAFITGTPVVGSGNTMDRVGEISSGNIDWNEGETYYIKCKDEFSNLIYGFTVYT